VNCQRAEVFVRTANHDGCDLSVIDFLVNNVTNFNTIDCLVLTDYFIILFGIF
jgi:hypothetical protein